MRSKPKLVLVMCFILMLVSAFWALGLTANPLPSDLPLTVSSAYLSIRNTIWCVGALLLAILLFLNRLPAPAILSFASVGWLIWDIYDNLALQSTAAGWPELVLPALAAVTFACLPWLPSMRIWFAEQAS